MPDWALALAVVIGTIIGASIGEFRHWRESRQRYQVMAFEKRLQAHQEAVSWCLKISDYMGPSKMRKKQGIEQLLDHVEEAGEWLNKNCLLLDTNSNASLLDVLEFATRNARDYTSGAATTVDEDKEIAKITQEIRKAIRCIAQGVGVKYIPDIKRRLKS